MSWALALAVFSLLLVLLMADEWRAWRIGFALGWIVTELNHLPRRLSLALAHRLWLLRLALAVRCHTLLSHIEGQLARRLPHATRLRSLLATRQRRYRLRLLHAWVRLNQSGGRDVL
jgi:hypothetical protein